MKYIEIVNWDKFQTFKDRRPKWVKLNTDIVEEFDEDGFPKKFFNLPDTAKLTFLMLLCRRAYYHQCVPYKSNTQLKKMLGINTVNVQPLIDKGFIKILQNFTKTIQNFTEVYTNPTPEREREGEKEREKEGRNIPPTLQQIKNFIQEKKYSVDADKFFNFYESKAWFVGKNKMKNWQAAVRTWLPKDKPLTSICVVCHSAGFKFQQAPSGQKIYLCEKCHSLFTKTSKNWGSLTPSQIESIVEKGKRI